MSGSGSGSEESWAALSYTELQTAQQTGIRLGVYQAHALAGPIGAAVCLAADAYVAALMLALGGLIGIAGWKRDFGFALRVQPRHLRLT